MVEELKPLPKEFETFEQFMAGTMTEEEARIYCANNPPYMPYGLRKVNPATGEGVSRYKVRIPGPRTPSASSTYVPKPAKVKAPVVTKNGVDAPREGTVGAQTWAMFDDLWSIRKEAFTKSVLEAEALNRHFNIGNVMTECSRWRKFHGHVWRLA